MPADNSNAALAAKLQALVDRLDRDYEERQIERKETKEYRSAVQSELSSLQKSTEETRKRMDKVEPVANMVTSWRARLAGAIMVLGFIGGIAWSAITFFRDEVRALLFGG